ncbi:MAG: metal-sulfur cluster assembly factor [Elusimicrobia bacterium]|nr:metal-sulfur cluster assembly factor [Elusimicrobiota bacterium]
MSETEKKTDNSVAEKLEASLKDSHENRKEMPTLQEIMNVLMAVEDPELHINVIDLGLIYKIDRDSNAGRIAVDMTLTSPACPYGPQLLGQAHAILARLPNVKEVKINTVWSPKWDPRVHASEVAQMLLGLI